MSKTPSNAASQTLPPQVLECLEKWWFGDERLGYKATVARLKQEFGITMSIGGTLTRLHERMARRRQRVTDLRTFLGESLQTARESIEAAGPEGERIMFKAGLIQIGALVMKLAETSEADPETVEELKGVFQTLAAGMKVSHAAEALAFENTKWQSQFAESFLSEAKRLVAERIANSNLSHAEKIAEMRQALFADVDAIQIALPPAA